MASQRSPYIVGPVTDHLALIWSPLLCLALAGLYAWSPLSAWVVSVGDAEYGPLAFVGACFSIGHLYLVFLRTHANREVNRRHPWRFNVAPLLLWGVMFVSHRAFILGLVVQVYWDFYHTAMQVFGLGRIYDARVNQDRQTGRWLDMCLVLIAFLFPVIASPALVERLWMLTRLEAVGLSFFDALPAAASTHHPLLLRLSIGLGLGYLAFYAAAYAIHARRGYRVSWLKVLLLSVFLLTSIHVWYFNTFGQAFFVVETFHAVQYMVIVWHMEKKNFLPARARASRWRRLALLALYLAFPFLIGTLTHATSHIHLLFTLATTVALLHFWYDGFVWSVRRREVET